MVKVKISEIQETLQNIIASKNSRLSVEEVETLALDYLEGELQGKQSHGIAAFPAVVGNLANAKADFKIIKETESFIYADAMGGFGALVGRRIADKLVNKAKKQGIALASIREMKSWLRPAVIAQYVADKDMIALVVNTGGPPMVAPPGGREPVVGTNPIGLGIPTSDKPVIVDMATSSRAWGEVRMAKRFGHALPEESFLDKEGIPTRSADEAHAALAMGAYKGFSLGLFIEILGGSLVGMNMGQGEVNEAYYTRNRGATILVINPALTVGSDNFKVANQNFISEIKNSPPAKHSNGVTIPGDRALKNKAFNLQNGYLEIDNDLWEEIKSYL